MRKTIPLLPTSGGGMSVPTCLWALLLAGMLAACVLVGAWSEPAKAAFPGTNGKLVFERDVAGDSEIFTMRVDGMGVVQLTRNQTDDSDPAWSPDGKKIAYTHQTPSSDFEIFVMRVDGTQKTRITRSRGYNFDPTWSPNGRRVAFVSDRDSTNSDYDSNIYSVRSDGTDGRQVTKNPASDYEPDWSPDGTKIAFATDRYEEPPSGVNPMSEIAVIHPDGSNVKRVTYSSTGFPGDERFYREGGPEWSPSGGRIAYHRYPDIYTIRPDGTGQKIITNVNDDYSSSYYPAWSPDGEKIAFNGGRWLWPEEDIVEYGIYLMNADGSGEQKIPGTGRFFGTSDWQRLPAQ